MLLLGVHFSRSRRRKKTKRERVLSVSVIKYFYISKTKHTDTFSIYTYTIYTDIRIWNKEYEQTISESKVYIPTNKLQLTYPDNMRTFLSN